MDTASSMAWKAGSVSISEEEHQRPKRCEHHLRAILRAVRINAVAEEIETARFWYRKSGGSLVLE